MGKENWHPGYKEAKNVIHNDIGVTKEEILDVFREVARIEVEKIVAESKPFIYITMRDVIKSAMTDAIREHRYPKVRGNVDFYGHNGAGQANFDDYVSGVMKREIVDRMREQFSVNIQVTKNASKDEA